MAMVHYDYSKLRGKIRELFNTQENFANAMKISKATISYKLNGLVEWTQEEIERAVQLLGIDATEIHVYFFTKKVENNSTEGGGRDERTSKD